MKKILVYSWLIFIWDTSTRAEIREIGSTYQYSTINAALAAAQNGDTLLIHWDAQNPIFPEHIVIDKTITLTSDWTSGSSWSTCPMIQYGFSTYNEIIRVDADNVTISKLRIQNQTGLGIATGDETDMDSEIGIYIRQSECVVSECEVTRCRVGILLANSCVAVLENTIDSCQIGTSVTARWYAPTQGQPIHPGNFFGIVQYETARTNTAYAIGTYHPNRITNCEIARNRFYGVVLRGGSMATVHNNRIVWNGTDRVLEGTHYGDGGILCLFTATEMNQTEVEMQSPMITSNTIYGNDGYQVCVVTDDPGREPREIANAPVLMSNIIGPDTLAYPTGTPTSAPHWLVSCTSESTAAATPQHGSAPIMAFNNLFRPDATGPERMYFAHPGNPTPTPGAPTSTPSPTRTPTPTGTQYTPSYTFNTPSSYDTPAVAPSFTPFATLTPTPPPGSPTFTPTAAPYKMDAATWSTQNTFGDPLFVGGSTVETFDFHLQDPVFQMTPTPNAPRSAAYDSGGFILNPGITQSNQIADVGYVDAGAHFPPNVPAVAQLDCDPYGQEGAIVTWTNPDHYPDNSLISDLAGNIFYFGHRNQSRIISIISQVYLEPTETYTFTSPPTLDTNVLGVAVYNTSGSHSSTVWVDLCN